MSLNRSEIAEIIAAVEVEGKAQLHLAPLREAVVGSPPQWQAALTAENPSKELWEGVWKPFATKLPRTVAALKKSLLGLGFLSTRSKPPSLVYFYKREGAIYAYRGFVPTLLQSAEATLIPNEFLEFYHLHNGFVDLFSDAMGPLPETKWFYLSDDKSEPAGSFLAVFNNGGGARFGFDLSERPPLSYIVWPDQPPTVTPDLWIALDEWMAAGLQQADPV